MTEERKRTALFNIDWQETSFVGRGDNPPARIVFAKDRPGITDTELEEVMQEVAAETDHRSTDVNLETLTKKRDVMAQATRLAKEQYPDLPEEAGRYKIWQERPDLFEAYYAAQDDEVPAPQVAQPVHKGADAYAKIDAAARELRPDTYVRSPSEARTEVVKLWPDLKAEYEAALGAR
jgi:hypothetical protein